MYFYCCFLLSEFCMTNYSLSFRKKLGLVSLVILATQLPSIANAMDLPMELEKGQQNPTNKRNRASDEDKSHVTKKPELNDFEEQDRIIIPLTLEDLENNIIDQAGMGIPAAQDRLMDLFYQGRYKTVISQQILFTFHLWEDIRRKCCEKDEYAYFLICNYKSIRKKFLQDSFSEMYNGIKKRVAIEDPKALCNMALIYFHGYGVPQDKKKAQELFKVAADKNHAPSQYSFALSCFVNKKPHEMQPDSEAFQYVQKAAWQDYAPAQNLLHLFLQCDPIEKCSLSIQKLHSSLPSAADQGYFYYALKHLADAVDNPDVHAQYNLAEFYARSHDWISANDYYKKAALNGHLVAKSKLYSLFQQKSLKEVLQPLSDDSYFKDFKNLLDLCVVCKDWKKTIDDWIKTKPGLIPVKFHFTCTNSLKTHKYIRSLPMSMSCDVFNTDETLKFPQWTKHDLAEPLSIHSFRCTLLPSRSSLSQTPSVSLLSKVNELFKNISFSICGLERLYFYSIPDLHLESIVKCLQPLKMKELTLSKTNINGQGIQTIIKNLTNSLQILDLTDNDFGDDECSAFCQKLPSLPELKILCLGKNYILSPYQNFRGSPEDGLRLYLGGVQNRKLIMTGAKPVISQPVLDDFKTGLDAKPTLEYLIFS